MLIVGITGVMGCGKSTVSRLLAQQGAILCDADQLARQAIAPATPGFQQVVERFGQQVVDEHGHIHRPTLAKLAFAHESALTDLEAIIHPQVQRLQATFLARQPTDSLVVLEIPLLFETGAHHRCDVTLAVVCGCQQEERLANRPHGQPAWVKERMLARQLSENDKKQLADRIIDNSSSLLETQQAVEGLWPWLLAQPARCWPQAWKTLMETPIQER
ncbi:MAG: dephospho-CoA kinase [Magnetococcales bacterium]|nr:dephospho-CoA kinase [Magnetococcales bacterium]NGZ27080.1 dephospho-CoA kinase [Magnetococcales bacterium]